MNELLDKWRQALTGDQPRLHYCKWLAQLVECYFWSRYTYRSERVLPQELQQLYLDQASLNSAI